MKNCYLLKVAIPIIYGYHKNIYIYLFPDASSDRNANVLTRTIEKLMSVSCSESGILVDKLVRLEPEILGGSLMGLQVFNNIWVC